jgi:4-amino-4-deoxy-L-arabinose transferase-like glycosyltransferase
MISIALEKMGGRRHPEGFLLVLLGLLILCIIILSLVPPVAKDELIHHLAVPKLYLKHGGMYEIPFMPFSYYPMNLDMLYLIPLYFGNDIIPKFIHFGFALLTAGLLFWYLKRRVGLGYALFGVVFFLSIPIIVKLSISAYVDLGVLFFSFASLLLLLKWVESGLQRKFLILAAVIAGLAMGTKYNGMVTTVLLTLFVPILYSRKGKGNFFGSALHGLLFLSIALLVFSPWMARDYSWKKNPIYPLYDYKFNPQKSQGSGEDQGRNESINGGLGVFVIRQGIYHEPWWEIALVPIRIFLEGQDGSAKYFDGKLNPFLLFLSVFAFWRIREEEEEVRKEKKAMLAFVVLFFTIAFFTSDLRIRYIAPMIPVLVVLSVMGADKLHRAIGKVKNAKRKDIFFAVLVVALASALAYNGQYVVDQFKEVEPLEYIAGKISRDEYLNRHRPEYAAMSFINHYLPQDAKVMLIFLGSRGYYCDRSYVYGDEALGPVFLGSGNAEEMYSKLKSMGITHLLIYDRLFGRWVRDNLKDRAEKTLKPFFSNYGKLVYSQTGFSIFALKSSFS